MKSCIFFHLSIFSLYESCITIVIPFNYFFFPLFLYSLEYQNFFHYYCDNTYDSSSWSARKDYPCAMQTQNKNQSCLKRFQCQARCEQRRRYKAIACKQMNSMKSYSIYVRSGLLVLLDFVSLTGMYYKSLARTIR